MSDLKKMDPDAVKKLKYFSLLSLTLQNSALGLSMRYARTRPGDMFMSSTAVVMAEVVKLIVCLGLVFNEESRVLNKFISKLHEVVIENYIDTIKVCVPSFVYLVQNNLLYVCASNLDAATYQVTYQLKILTTALFAVIILKRSLRNLQWGSLVLLVIGVALVQLSQTEEAVSSPNQSKAVGFAAAITACFLSGFAGIYFEKILKGSDISVWMRNVQLSMLSVPLGILTCYWTDGAQIAADGFFHGYDIFIWYLVILQACGGLIVAAVVKYADNILKGFATSLAIIISCIVSIYAFGFILTLQFCFGTTFVIASVFLYSYVPKPSPVIPVQILKA